VSRFTIIPSDHTEITQVAKDLRTTQVVEKIQGRLQDIHTLTKNISDQVNLLRKDFKEIMDNLKLEGRSKTLGRQEMPSKPNIFYGRDHLVDKTGRILSSSTPSYVCLLGPGGMGKTSLALAIVESPLVQAKFPDKHSVWVPCVEATSASLLHQVIYSSLGIKGQTENIMDDIMNELKGSKEPRLLLFDNFETPWNTADGHRAQVQDILCKLEGLKHVSILITMRGSRPPTDGMEWHEEIIPPTDKDACRLICFKINPRWKDDRDLDKLLDALGCMPFAVTLMANLGSESQSTASELLEEWLSIGTDMLSPKDSPENNMNRSISLSVDSPSVANDENALRLLATLSLLPAGTTRENLRYWSPNGSKCRAIAVLSRAALLQTSSQAESSTSQTLFVLPVVQSYMLHHNRIPEDVRKDIQLACCQYVLDHACRYRDENFTAHCQALAAEETNIQSLLIDQSGSNTAVPVDRLLETLLALTWYRGDAKPNIMLAEHTLKIAMSLGTDRALAEAHFCVANTYAGVHNFAVAVLHLRRAYALFDELAHKGEDVARRRVECGVNLAQNLLFLDEADGGLEVLSILQNMRVLAEQHSDRYGVASANSTLGLYHFSQDMDEALKAFRTAKDVFIILGCRVDAFNALFMIADILERQFAADTVVLNALEEAWMSVEGQPPYDSHSYGASSHFIYGSVLIRKNQMQEALLQFEKGLLAYANQGGVMGIGDSMAYIGYAYLHLGDYVNAHAAYEAAREKYASAGESLQYPTTQCEENLDRILKKQQNSDENIGFHRPRTHRDAEDLFYPGAPSKKPA